MSFVLRHSSLRKKPHESPWFLFFHPSSFVLRLWEKSPINKLNFLLLSFVLRPSSLRKSHMNQLNFFYLSRSSFVLRHWEKRLLNQPNFFFSFHSSFVARPLFLEKKRNRNSSSLIPRTKDERRKTKKEAIWVEVWPFVTVLYFMSVFLSHTH